MIQQELCQNKRILSQGQVVVASCGFFEKITNAPDLADAIRKITLDAGISWEEIKVMTIAQYLESSISLADFFDQTEMEINILTPGNLVGAIVATQRALVCEPDSNFGLAIYTHPESTFGPICVNLVVLKKTDYFDSTRWLPENIVCSVLNAPQNIDISRLLIDKANQDLIRYQEPPIYYADNIVTVTYYNVLSGLELFFDRLSYQEQLTILIWLHEYHAQSAVLIRT